LQKIVSSLLTYPNDWRNNISQKRNEQFAHQLSNWEEIKQFFELIGFREGNFNEHRICDEGMKCLEAALEILNTHIKNLKSASGGETPIFQDFKEDHHYSRDFSPLLTADNSCGKIIESKNGGIKLQGILSRHLKQERRDTLCHWKKNELSDASFNSEGYFYQTCQKRDQKKRKCFFSKKCLIDMILIITEKDMSFFHI